MQSAMPQHTGSTFGRKVNFGASPPVRKLPAPAAVTKTTQQLIKTDRHFCCYHFFFNLYHVLVR